MSLYAWQVYQDDEWGLIAATFTGGVGTAVLVIRNEEIARAQFGALARLHADRTGLPIRLARYELAEVLEEPDA